MKISISRLRLLAITCIIGKQLHPQAPGGCASAQDPSSFFPQDPAHKTQSTAPCTNLSDYIQPNTTLVFNVNFHFFRPTAQSPNYNGPRDYYKNVKAADCDSILKYVNQRMANLRQQPDIPANPPASSSFKGAKVQYNLAKDVYNVGTLHVTQPHVYFHVNDSAWLSPYGFNTWAYNRYAVNAGSEINIFFTADSAVLTGGVGRYGHLVMSSFPWTPGQWCGTCAQQTFIGTLVHELGHTAGLLGHTNSQSSWGINMPAYCYYPDGGTTDYYKETSGPCWGNVNSVSQGGCGSNNIMGYNNDRTYLSPNQLGSFFYSVYGGINTRFTNAAYPVDRCVYDSSQTIKITRDTAWGNATLVSGDVVIETGRTLTVYCTVVFSTGSRLLVKPGGRLILDGGTLTTNCGFWEGVQVWGNSSQSQQFYLHSQMPRYQGLVVISNGGMIMHARTGITTIARYTNGGMDWSKTGGIIQATTANFTGNIKDVEFMYYQAAPSASYFYNCTFQANDQPAGGWPDARISLHGINGVSILGCSFFGNSQAALAGNGITSTDASYKIGNYLAASGSKSSYFGKFVYGIHAQNTSLLYPIIIDSATFYVCRAGGIYIGGGQYCSVTNNTFKTQYAFSTPQTPDYALYLDACHGYKVTGNKIAGPHFANGGTHIGICINNSGAGNNSVYNNSFSYLNYGVIAQGVNQGGDKMGEQGLVISCNDFGDCGYDISVTGGPGAGIMQTQGSFTRPALYVRNRYSMEVCGWQNTFFVSTAQPYQLLHPSFRGDAYEPLQPQGCSDNHKIKIYQLPGTFDKSTQCPANCAVCRPASEIENSIQNYKNLLTYSRAPADTEQTRQLQDELSLEENQLGLLSNERIRGFLHDGALDSVIAELGRKRNPNYKRQLIVACLQQGNAALARNFLDSVRASEPINTDFYAISLQLIDKRAGSPRYIELLKNNLALKDELLTMANNPHSEACVPAQALLGLAYGMKFAESFFYPGASAGQRAGEKLMPVSNFDVFPNPANTNLRITCALGTSESGRIDVYGPDGRLVKVLPLDNKSQEHILDISELKDGIYFVNLLKENTSLGNKKIIVMR